MNLHPSKQPRIVFMGTPEFAVASLDAIFRAGYEIRAVVTVPDKPSGRGLQLHSSPVKEYALQHSLPVLQPLKLKDPHFLQQLRDVKADLQVVVAFRMLPEEVWNLPPLGTFNLHASLLPQYRGAAPINHAVMNGETKTGVTTFFINHEIDKGSVIFTRETPIGDNESAGDVHDRLMKLGADLAVKTIDAIVQNQVKPVEQHFLDVTGPLKPAPKINKADCRIRWNEDVKTVHNFIRGLSPYPTAWSEIITAKGEILSIKIFTGTPVFEKPAGEPGSLKSDRKNHLQVACINGYISIGSIQLQAKKRMNIADFLRGFPDITDCRLT